MTAPRKLMMKVYFVGSALRTVFSRFSKTVRSADPTRIAIAHLVLLLSVGGCQSPTPQKSVSGNPPLIDEPNPPVDARKLTPEQMAIVDPCAIRLQDITGAILQYYVLNRHLPDKLDELRAFVDAGTELQLTCPVSHQPYAYIPNGLQSAGRNKRIVLHDAAGSHDGNRWCVLMAPLQSGKAPYLEVVLMPDNLFRTYLPVSEQ